MADVMLRTPLVRNPSATCGRLAPSAVTISAPGGERKVELSERAATIVGLTPGHHPRNVLRDMLDPDEHVVNRAQVQKCIRERADFDVQYRLTRPDGERRWLSGRGRAAYKPDGGIASIIGVVQDIRSMVAGDALAGELRERELAGGGSRPVGNYLDSIVS